MSKIKDNQYLQDSAVFARCSAYVILDPSKKEENLYVGKILVSYPKDGMGNLKVNVFDWTGDDSQVHYGSASGYGYDKLSAALHNIPFGKIVFKDHPEEWQSILRDAGYILIRVC